MKRLHDLGVIKEVYAMVQPGLHFLVDEWVEKNFKILNAQYAVPKNFPEERQDDFKKYADKNLAYQLGEALMDNGLISIEKIEEDLEFPRDHDLTRATLIVPALRWYTK